MAGQRAGRDRGDLLLLPLALTAAMMLLVSDVGRWATLGPRTAPVIATAIRLADGSPILAEDLPGERIALAGGRIWAGNPIDAFPARTQALYLDFLAGDRAGDPALSLPGVRVAIVGRRSAAASLLDGDRSWRLALVRGGVAIYERAPVGIR